jgi:glutamate transport system substrate-binding protein
MLCFVVVLAAACVPPEPVVDLTKDYPEDTVMGEIQAEGRIVIGIPDDAYPLGYVDHNDQAQGFAAELGRAIADKLGVDAHFISGTSEQLLGLPKEGAADVTFPALAITEERVDEKYQFSDPYYVAHQRLLVSSRDEGAVASVNDLSGEKACAISGDETQVPLDAIDPSIEVVQAEAQDCLARLVQGSVSAVTGPDFLLAGLRLQRPDELAVTGDELTTEGLGAVIERGAAAWTDYVNGVLFFAKSEGAWLDAYSETVGLGLDEPKEPPEITAEEAAALYPSDL